MHCETALAMSEIEYGDHTSPSIYVKFPLVDGQTLPLGACVKPSIVIWTTTPWTLPANRAVTVKPDLRYGAVPHAGETLIMAVDLVPAFFTALGVPAPAVRATCLGQELEGLQVRHPLDAARTVPVILGEHVTTDTGTGCVHTAPGHGQEDYQVGLKYNLEVASPVDERGCFTAEAPAYKGQHVFKANAAITAALQAQGILFDAGTTNHSYPHCWRCHKPLIFRATEQWFMGIERHALRARAQAAISATTWVPESSRHRIANMMEGAPDWCLSRQRLWGVPIPALYCTACGKEHVGRAMIEQVATLVEREGSDAWFAAPLAALVPDGTACAACGGREFRKERDILDVWFDSGVSHKAVLTRRAELRWPADVYLEGSDQHRGWFQVSLLTGVALCDVAPYKAVVTHGWTLSESGEKESKSKGNFTDPEWVYNEMGADILRLWVSSVNYMQDVMISPSLLRQMGDAYRRMRNTFKFLLGNLYDFEPRRDGLPQAQLRPLDRYMLHRLEELRAEVIEAYERYEFYRVFHLLHNFCAVDLSARYCDILKDTLYVEAAAGPARRSAQTVLWQITVALTHLAAPILAFTCDEVWEHLAARATNNDSAALPSVHVSTMPAAHPEHCETVLAEHYAVLWRVREDVLRELETLRARGEIGAGLDAAVELATDDAALMGVLRAHAAALHELCIVSQVRVQAAPDAGAWLAGVNVPALRLRVQRAQGAKCARCWNYSETVGAQAHADDLCARCAGVLRAAIS
jgi:isoleucyl-tRNA synthetase